MPGQLDRAQQLVQRRARVVGRERDAVVLGQPAGGGELVEPPLGAAGGQVADHGHQRVDVRRGRPGLLGRGLGHGERGPVRVHLRWADHVGEHLGRAAAGGARGLAGVLGLVGVPGDDEQHVRLPPPGGLHVRRRAVGAGPDDAVAGADVAAVRGVHGRRVGEGDLLAHVGRRERDRVGQRLGALLVAAGDPGDGQPAVPIGGGDPIGLPVDRGLGIDRAVGVVGPAFQMPGVAAGLHQVPDPGHGAAPLRAGRTHRPAGRPARRRDPAGPARRAAGWTAGRRRCWSRRR